MNVKDRVLIQLEQHRADAEKEQKKWSVSYQRYVSDLLFAEEHGFPLNTLTESSRDLAKNEMGKAREMKRLFTVAINAVRRA